jgi:hypothetical protein
MHRQKDSSGHAKLMENNGGDDRQGQKESGAND